MTEKNIVNLTIEYVKNTLAYEKSGHDWHHTWRVWKLARYIAAKEKANLLIVELAALLHDIADWKTHQRDIELGPKVARNWLHRNNIPEEIINTVCEIIHTISFKGAGEVSKLKNIEAMIVQDADRLDAMGAIGIARAFTYGGYSGQIIYDPEKEPFLHNTFDEYKNIKTTTINHFYEKLLLLTDRLNTETARAIAKKRHQFMLLFLETFVKEHNEYQ